MVLAVLVSGSVAGCGGALEPAGLTNATAGSLLVLLPEAITSKILLVLDLNLLGPVAVWMKIKNVINRKRSNIQILYNPYYEHMICYILDLPIIIILRN